MENKKTSVPVWMKIVLIFLLLIFAASGFLVTFVNIQSKNAKDGKVLPQAFGYQYLAVSDKNSSEYYQGCLLLLKSQYAYLVGDEVAVQKASSGSDVDYQLVKLSSVKYGQAQGTLIGSQNQIVKINDNQNKIVGKIKKAMPALGNLYSFMLGLPGIAVFLILPAVVSILWIIFMMVLYMKRQEADLIDPELENSFIATNVSPQPASANAVFPPTNTTSKETFNVFESEPAELQYIKQNLVQPEPPKDIKQPQTKEDQQPQAAPKLVEPSESKAPAVPAPPIQPQQPMIQPVNPAADTTLEPEPPMGSQLQFEPPYLYENICESMDELRKSLHGENSAGTVEIVLDGKTGTLDTQQQQCLDEINSFDADKIIEDIKKKNESYEKMLEETRMAIEKF